MVCWYFRNLFRHSINQLLTNGHVDPYPLMLVKSILWSVTMPSDKLLISIIIVLQISKFVD